MTQTIAYRIFAAVILSGLPAHFLLSSPDSPYLRKKKPQTETNKQTKTCLFFFQVSCNWTYMVCIFFSNDSWKAFLCLFMSWCLDLLQFISYPRDIMVTSKFGNFNETTIMFVFYVCCHFKQGLSYCGVSSSLTQTDLKFMILPPQPPKCWEPPHSAFQTFLCGHVFSSLG